MKNLMLSLMVLLLAGACFATNWTGADPNDPTGSNWFAEGNWSAGLPSFTSGDTWINVNGVVVDVNDFLVDPNHPELGTLGLVAEAYKLNFEGTSSPSTLNINEGAALQLKWESAVSYNPGGLANVNVYGTLESSALLLLPRKGNAHVSVYPGGVIDCRVTVDGQAANMNIESRAEGGTVPQPSSGTLDMYGGAIYCGEAKWPRMNGQATLNLMDGEFNTLDTPGGVMSKDFRLAHSDPYDRGMVNQSGGLLKCDQLIIGGTASAATGADTGDGVTGYAIYNLTGGELNCRQILSSSAALAPDQIQMNLLGGTLNFTEWHASMGPMVNQNTVVSPGRYSNNAPMDETMQLVIQGDYSDAGVDPDVPVLSFDLGGTSAGNNYDRIVFQGAVSLDSALQVTFVDGFELTMAPGDTFTIVQSTNEITGGFTNLVGGRVEAYAGESLEATFLVTIDNTVDPKVITLTDAILTNVPPTITAADVYTYDAVKDSILIDTTVDHPSGTGDVTYAWTVISQPDGSTITPDPATLTTNDITIGVDLLGDYVLQLTATKTPTGKFATADILVAVRADACEAAKAQPDFELLIGDIDEDCDVDMVDFSLLASTWLEVNSI